MLIGVLHNTALEENFAVNIFTEPHVFMQCKGEFCFLTFSTIKESQEITGNSDRTKDEMEKFFALHKHPNI